MTPNKDQPFLLFKPWLWMLNPRWPILSGLPSIQFRVVAVTVLDFLTLWWGWHISETMHVAMAANPAYRPDAMILAIYGSWLGLLAGLHGFTLKGYMTKRQTSFDGNLEEDRGSTEPPGTERPIVDPSTLTQEHEARVVRNTRPRKKKVTVEADPPVVVNVQPNVSQPGTIPQGAPIVSHTEPSD